MSVKVVLDLGLRSVVTLAPALTWISYLASLHLSLICKIRTATLVTAEHSVGTTGIHLLQATEDRHTMMVTYL